MRTCEVDNCQNKHAARGMCHHHYNKVYYKRVGKNPCTVDGCGRKQKCASLCAMHHYRLLEKGNVGTACPTYNVGLEACGDTLEDRFWAHVTKEPSECWIWSGPRVFKNEPGHWTSPARWLWLRGIGVPSGILLSTCGNKNCIRSEHRREGRAAA